jgi:hypothetical protein
MYELKKIGNVFKSKFVGTGPSSYKKKNLPGRGLTKVEKHWVRQHCIMRRVIPSTTYQILLEQRNLGRWNKWDMWHVWRITEMCTGFRRGNMNQRVNLTDFRSGRVDKT